MQPLLNCADFINYNEPRVHAKLNVAFCWLNVFTTAYFRAKSIGRLFLILMIPSD